ncbi:MAG TPA: hypothetical protein VN157_07155 [Caulobacter sp.]|nr:hypothetical protein [Caulobacter sp.]
MPITLRRGVGECDRLLTLDESFAHGADRQRNGQRIGIHARPGAVAVGQVRHVGDGDDDLVATVALEAESVFLTGAFWAEAGQTIRANAPQRALVVNTT